MIDRGGGDGSTHPRWLARAPIPLYRRGLGWLLGIRIMMLEHRGRRSGQLRYAVLEVLGREPGALVLVPARSAAIAPSCSSHQHRTSEAMPEGSRSMVREA
ncbi:PNPOx family protein [Saccharopolyspora pogona]|uniref:hypothetical protein n=1 Tax=Saccharopolyspora pogona TaxID=333966 RepID=UPI001687B17B|nr:hypothetical protein [Saccharopolyspora pogona]